MRYVKARTSAELDTLTYRLFVTEGMRLAYNLNKNLYKERMESKSDAQPVPQRTDPEEIMSSIFGKLKKMEEDRKREEEAQNGDDTNGFISQAEDG